MCFMVDLVQAGFLLVLVGFVVLAASMLRSAKNGGGQVKGGGVVMIGPIPIIFGSDAKWASVAIALAIVLVLVYIFGVLL
jgi:uncharacterized protein (TIGR00304 family)